METKIVKTLKFFDDESNIQINAVMLEGLSAQALRESVSTNDLQAGNACWLFNCGTSTTNI